MAGLHIIDQGSRSSLIGREHLIVYGDKEFHACRSREIAGFAFVHIAHNISLFAEVTPAIDGQERDIDLQLVQAFHQTIVDDRVTGMIDALLLFPVCNRGNGRDFSLRVLRSRSRR